MAWCWFVPTRWVSRSAIVLLLLGRSTLVVHGDFGDYVDPTFNCPATTTCQQVCVANVSDCPLEMRCEDDGVEPRMLCADGSCATVCTGNEVSPCEFACAPVACQKVIDTVDQCSEKYGDLIAAQEACSEAEAAEAIFLWTFREGGFVFFYVWICTITFAVLAWCAYNQRFAPVAGSTQSLELSASIKADKNSSLGWQTGYQVHPMGLAINVCTVVTLIGFQILLAWLTIQYYIQQELITGLNGQFQDETQVLIMFEITWAIGFVWTFAMKFPYSIRSMHYRRCVLDSATHVAVAVTDPKCYDSNEVTFDKSYIAGMRNCFSSFYRCVHDVMTFVFSDKNFFGTPRASNGFYTVVPVMIDPDDGTKYIVFRFRRYNLAEDKFVPGLLTGYKHIKDILAADTKTGLTESQVKANRRIVGENSISMKKPRFLVSLKREISKPFYTYQAFMVWTWAPVWYYYMAITWSILIISAALAVTMFQYRNEVSLYKITETIGDVKVIRNGRTVTIPHQELVPGDILLVEDGVAFCDMVVVSSSSLLLDESALTGEANYVGKVAIDPLEGNDEYDEKRHKRNSVFAGTKILETDESRAIVLKTSSYTARGELIREIFSYKRHQFKFDVEVPIVITILFFYAIFAFAITNYFVGDQAVFGFFYGMYVVGTVLPPLLPTVFTVSVGVSDERLARKRIACTNSESILVAGKVTHAFFDKTGTLTKQGLDFLSVRSASDWNQVATGEQTSFMSDRMAAGMTVCHTLTRSKNGDLVGNPVDRVMLEASGGSIVGQEATDKDGNKMAVLKQFDFDHHRMTQSTIVKTQDGRLILYVKGSGENIKLLCKNDTIPPDFDSALRQSATKGIYQISMAFKPLPVGTDISTLSRSTLESELEFVGVINFKNSMREDTPEVIRHLSAGEVKSFMITGDSILTGIKIARESGILKDNEEILVASLTDEEQVVWKTEAHEGVELPSIESMVASGTKLAMSGEAFSYILSEEEEKTVAMMDLIRVYGRCTPYDKVAVVSEFVKQGYVTMMCGDGGNDCGALKTAHVGVALSDAEASIVAPFTSLDKTISSVVDVLLEGRCALASALAAYKFILMYGQVQTVLQIMNAYFAITFTEWCWVLMDGLWTVSLAFTLPLSRAADKLSPARPTASVLGIQTVCSTCGVLALNFLFVVAALAYLWNQDWFQCRKWDSTDLSNVLVIGDNYESQVLFLVGGFQYIASAATFNFGYEFRSNWFRNYFFVALFFAFSFIQIYIALVPGDLSCIWRVNCLNENVRRGVTEDLLPIQNKFNTTVMPEYFQRGLVGLMLANAAAIMGYEYFVVNGIRRYFAAKKREGKNLESWTKSDGRVEKSPEAEA